jgi:hypothetical protein
MKPIRFQGLMPVRFWFTSLRPNTQGVLTGKPVDQSQVDKELESPESKIESCKERAAENPVEGT